MINYKNSRSSASENKILAYSNKSIYKNTIYGIYADIYIRFGIFYFKTAVIFFSNFIKINNKTQIMDNAIYNDNLYEIKLKSKQKLRIRDYKLYKSIKNKYKNNQNNKIIVYYNNYI